jgi:hypothetical protein
MNLLGRTLPLSSTLHFGGAGKIFCAGCFYNVTAEFKKWILAIGQWSCSNASYRLG